MRKKQICRLLAGLLSLCFLSLSLVACAPTPTPAPPDKTGSTGGTAKPEPNPDEKPEEPQPDVPVLPSYAGTYTPVSLGNRDNGGYTPTEGIGTDLAADRFPLLGRTAAGTVEITTSELRALVRSGSLENKVYRVSGDGYTIESVSGRTYSFGGAVILANFPLSVRAARNMTLSDLTWVNTAGSGSAMEVSSSDGLVLEGVEAIGTNGFSFHAGCTDLTLSGCRAVATGTAFAAEAVTGATVYASAFGAGACAFSASGSDFYVDRCYFSSPAGSVVLAAEDSRLSASTLRGALTAQGATNLLLAGNRLMAGTGATLRLSHAKNISCVRNTATDAKIEDCHSAYFVENTLAGNLYYAKNNYLLANQNTVAAACNLGFNQNLSGDTVTAVGTYPGVGANEDLLPKVDKELFLTMPVRRAVREREGACRSLREFLEQESRERDAVYLLPGAYALDATVTFGTETKKNTVIYAYGTYWQKSSYQTATIHVQGADGFTLKGGMLDHTENSTGQIVVIGKENGQIQAIAGAGMIENWLDGRYYSFTGLTSTTYGYRPGHAEPYADMGGKVVSYDEETGILNLFYHASLYRMISVGDSIVCRGVGGAVLWVTDAVSPRLEDVTVLGAAGFCYNDRYVEGEGCTLLRLWDTPGFAPRISREMYDRYRALEEKYGVSFGVYLDADGNCRGTPPLCSSVDATHSNHSTRGLQAISCLFEGMCDDGTNQTSAHGRLCGYEERGGSVVLRYKNNLSAVMQRNGSVAGSVCAPFRAGDRLYAYTADGMVVCDGRVQSASVPLRTEKNVYGGTDTVYEVTVPREAFDPTFLAGIDLSSTVTTDPKVCVDNRNRSSSGYRFENCLVRNARARGLVLKASDGVVTHCSFVNLGMAAILAHQGTDWGESGMFENLEISDNYMENTGCYLRTGEDVQQATISVAGLCTQPREGRQVFHSGIRIIGNVMVSRNNTYALALNSVRGVTVKDNRFGRFGGIAEGATPEDAAHPKYTVYLTVCEDVEFSGNTYPDYGLAEDFFRRGAIRRIYGKDVETDDGTPFFADQWD